MAEEPLISIYTQVYNTKESDLRQCIESVLGQTYSNFEYIIFDNGSTNGSAEILQEYAQRDRRIKLIRIETNIIAWRFQEVAFQASGAYLSCLDSDDWWDPVYLESLLRFTEENRLDIAGTGCVFHIENSETENKRAISQDLILDNAQFSLAYPYYHAFFRTFWGRLTRMEIIKSFPQWPDIIYGLDTIGAFYNLRLSKRMGIQGSALYHYRIHGDSSSYQYDPKRFAADVYLYNDAIDFLKPYGVISRQNQEFLYAVYSNAIRDTMGVIHNSGLTTEEKIHEYAQIAIHPITRMAYQCREEYCRQSRQILLSLVCAEGLSLRGDDEDLRRAIQTLLPRCGIAVTAANLPLFLGEELQAEFLADDRDAVVKTLLKLLPDIKNPQLYDLGTTIQRLGVDHWLLFQVDDMDFLRTYPDLYLLLWDNKNMEALDRMTGFLLEDKVKQGAETFLKLYIDLAARENQESAFVFGKIRLACLYCYQRCWDKAEAAVLELEDLGLKDIEEVKKLRTELEEQNRMESAIE